MKCADCPRRARPGLSRCGACRLKLNARVRAMRAERRAKGVCIYCTRPSFRGFVYCLVHRAAKAASARTPHGKAKQAEYNWRHQKKRILARVYGGVPA